MQTQDKLHGIQFFVFVVVGEFACELIGKSMERHDSAFVVLNEE